MNLQTATDRTIGNEILVPEAPPVPGLRFRHYRGEIDLPQMLGVIHAAKLADGVERSETLEDITRNYAHLTNCDPLQDVIIAEVDGQPAGYSRVTWWNNQAGEWVYQHFGFMKPEWRNLGIGQAMLRHCQRRLRAIAAGQLASGERPAGSPGLFEAFASDSETCANALLQGEGYQAVRRFYTMLRPDLENIPDLSLPPGVEVRPVRWPEQARQIWDAEMEAFRDHWGFAEPDEQDYRNWVEEVDQDASIDPSLWRVAWQGDQVAGMVRSFINALENQEYKRLRGWTEHISTRRPWRRQGVARALIAQSLHALKARGMQEAALGVDTENTSGALRVYESVGFRPVKVHTTYHKPMD